jgi:aspartyl/asparaginyl beta-hydroxylase (cupin superfamily)
VQHDLAVFPALAQVAVLLLAAREYLHVAAALELERILQFPDRLRPPRPRLARMRVHWWTQVHLGGRRHQNWRMR